jgi:hypothetical protein
MNSVVLNDMGHFHIIQNIRVNLYSDGLNDVAFLSNITSPITTEVVNLVYILSIK